MSVKHIHYAPPLPGHTTVSAPPRQPLTVSDVERLAKAGVQINFADIAGQVMNDGPPPPTAADLWPNSLNESFWQRWKRANPKRYGMGQDQPFQIFATEFKDTVNVYVAPSDAKPFILEDDAALFPSDALMAKLALWERTKP